MSVGARSKHRIIIFPFPSQNGELWADPVGGQTVMMMALSAFIIGVMDGL